MAAPGAFMGARPPMDRAHEGDPTRPPAESFGLTPGVPPRRNRTAPWDCDREAHKGRNMVERVCLCSMVLRPVERLVFSPKER